MRVYLDNCCYNRPFDPQTDLRIHLETVAKVRVEGYTSWHQRHFANGETVRELGEKIKTFVAAKRQEATA